LIVTLEEHETLERERIEATLGPRQASAARLVEGSSAAASPG
jgi:hypothetical protein